MLVKIGFTKSYKSLDKRLLSFKCACPYPLKVEAIMAGSKLKESCLHSFFLTRHESGEWFRLSADEVKRMVSKYKHWNPLRNGTMKMPNLCHQVQKPYFK